MTPPSSKQVADHLTELENRDRDQADYITRLKTQLDQLQRENEKLRSANWSILQQPLLYHGNVAQIPQ
jgi:regulator of replication initiation timing